MITRLHKNKISKDFQVLMIPQLTQLRIKEKTTLMHLKSAKHQTRTFSDRLKNRKPIKSHKIPKADTVDLVDLT